VARIPQRLRRLVTVRAKNRCEYCLSPAEQTGIPMTIDHVIPRAKGGVSNEGNLCLACSRCNGRKRDQTHARDPATGRWVQLFHPL
jgi:5-methylcytosine-specific restriction endonuclease McrA